MRLGNLSLSSNVFLGPMAGVSDAPFRRAVKRFGAGLVFSEMIASYAVVRENKRTMKMLEISDMERPAAVQIAGCEPGIMADAAKLNCDLGAELIDINMGCPAKKIVNNYAGSFLMKDEKLAASIIEAVVKASSVPVTLKIRLGWDDGSKNAVNIAKIAESLGIAMITVHGRTRAQMFSGKADWEHIGKVKQAVSIPVIGNGDVLSIYNAREMIDVANVDGVMISRGSYGKPWIIHHVAQFLSSGSVPDAITKEHLIDVILTHLEEIMLFYGKENGTKIARKHLSWYSIGMSESACFRGSVNTCDDYNNMYALTKNFFMAHAY